MMTTNKQIKLFSTCPLSIYEASISIIKLFHCLNLNKASIKTLLRGFRELLPMASKLPLTVPGLMKISAPTSSGRAWIGKARAASNLSGSSRIPPALTIWPRYFRDTTLPRTILPRTALPRTTLPRIDILKGSRTIGRL
ncbi:unnamed protein product [Didymodactylos carnosus]|uniref:Uncharacterized protein n=1 Tax=Didymodactylos carnosus TaxID=1234261 RepID=A0A815PC01_9BILA|nr:unnamed protein product [Didymodactylos carnosus]CAF4321410.1 unnamed protein product [Didymodactylos carnosus]